MGNNSSFLALNKRGWEKKEQSQNKNGQKGLRRVPEAETPPQRAPKGSSPLQPRPAAGQKTFYDVVTLKSTEILFKTTKHRLGRKCKPRLEVAFGNIVDFPALPGRE